MKPIQLVAATTLAVSAGAALAQAHITQATAAAGNVTPGDAPGFPITISAPGHYVLKGNLSVPAGVGGIEITTPNVTLDLNGFTVGGPVSCTQNSSTKAVTCSAPVDLSNNSWGIQGYQPNIVVRNGTVQGFAGNGISLSSGFVVDNLKVLSNSGKGAALGAHSGPPGRVSRSSFSLNGAQGAWVAAGLVVHSTFSGNHSHGLLGKRMTIIDCMATSNGNAGIGGDGNNPGAGYYGKPSTVRGTTLLENHNGATTGLLFSLGANFNGSAPF